MSQLEDDDDLDKLCNEISEEENKFTFDHIHLINHSKCLEFEKIKEMNKDTIQGVIY